ncbi:MAG: flagellar basal body L-ring protein FlgH [Planctomycetes bacterium]|nr:flagellar basal body L-ring protein FlgH [Planctomycetota bacterium]
MTSMMLLLALTQSLLQDDASPYDPPKKPALRKHDHVKIEFAAPAKAPAEAKPRWDRELRQWVRFDNKDAAANAATVMAEVLDIRPNGTLVLQAIKRRTVNGVEELLKLTGEAAPANVNAGRVSAEHVLNLSVVIEGPVGRASWLPGASVPGDCALAPYQTCRDVRLPAEVLS